MNLFRTHPGMLLGNIPKNFAFKPYSKEEEKQLFILWKEDKNEKARECICLSMIGIMKLEINRFISKYAISRRTNS